MYLYVHTTWPLHVTGFGVDTEPTRAGVTVLPQASVIDAGAPGFTAAAGHDTVDDPFGGGVKVVEGVIVYVYVQSAVVTPSHAVYLYVHTTWPLQVTGFGVDTEPTSAGITVLPHASVIDAGAPGLTAAVGHETVEDPFGGGVRVIDGVTVYVYVQSAVVTPSHAVYLYVQMTCPLHVTGFGVDTDPTSAGVTVLPHASVIEAGAPGFTAAAGHDTVYDPFGGRVRVIDGVTVYVYVQSAVVTPSHAVYLYVQTT